MNYKEIAKEIMRYLSMAGVGEEMEEGDKQKYAVLLRDLNLSANARDQVAQMRAGDA